jgi:hypothetical protein
MSCMGIHCGTKHKHGWLPITDCACRVLSCFGDNGHIRLRTVWLSLAEMLKLWRSPDRYGGVKRRTHKETPPHKSPITWLYCISFPRRHVERLCRHIRSCANAMVPRCAARLSSSAQRSAPSRMKSTGVTIATPAPAQPHPSPL